LMPTICRLGDVSKPEIGAIRIFDRETKFEIVKGAEDRFRAAIARGLEDGMTIETAVAPGPKDKPVSRWDKSPRPPRRDDDDRPARAPRPLRPHADAPKKPWAPRPAAEVNDAPTARPVDAEGKWIKRTKGTPTPEGKQPWVDKKKKPWAPRADAAPAPASAGELPWKGKPKGKPVGGDRPWAARDARGKPAGKPFKPKKPRG
ncbi:MAG: DEAD/DEAH box helicase, partial [Brevundimonas sp.]